MDLPRSPWLCLNSSACACGSAPGGGFNFAAPGARRNLSEEATTVAVGQGGGCLPTSALPVTLPAILPTTHGLSTAPFSIPSHPFPFPSGPIWSHLHSHLIPNEVGGGMGIGMETRIEWGLEHGQQWGQRWGQEQPPHVQPSHELCGALGMGTGRYSTSAGEALCLEHNCPTSPTPVRPLCLAVPFSELRRGCTNSEPGHQKPQ